MNGQRLVHIVDNDPEIQDSLSFLLRAEGIAATRHSSAMELLTALDNLKSGCLVIDIRMPGMSGLDLQGELQRRGCQWPVIVITGHGDVETAVHAMKAGAVDFLQKPFAKADLMAALDAAFARTADHSPPAAECIRAAEAIASLSRRERQIVDGLVKGQVNKTIAHELGISPRTVEIHRASAMRKLAVHSLSELLHIAFLADMVGGQGDVPGDAGA